MWCREIPSHQRWTMKQDKESIPSACSLQGMQLLLIRQSAAFLAFSTQLLIFKINQYLEFCFIHSASVQIQACCFYSVHADSCWLGRPCPRCWMRISLRTGWKLCPRGPSATWAGRRAGRCPSVAPQRNLPTASSLCLTDPPSGWRKSSQLQELPYR